MSGLEQVKSAIASALESAGVSARIAYAPGWAMTTVGREEEGGLRTGETRVGG